MAVYKVTRVEHLHDINFEAKDNKELIELYHEGLIDELLSEKNAHQHYKITDENGNVVYEHTYT